jgi:ligand-binding sensor domain-containing protein
MHNRKLLSFIFGCFFWVLHFTGNAQAPVFKNFVFDKEKKEAKLSKIFQDKRGYLWLGTNFGICRYDGMSFNYLENNKTQVTAIAESNDGVVWVGYMNGDIAYIQNNIVTEFSPKEGLPKIKISDIVFDKENRLWFATYGTNGEGIYCYEKDILYNINHDDGLTDNNVYDLLIDNDKIWAATDMGIIKAGCQIILYGACKKMKSVISGLHCRIKGSAFTINSLVKSVFRLKWLIGNMDR